MTPNAELVIKVENALIIDTKNIDQGNKQRNDDTLQDDEDLNNTFILGYN
jgi:hypothetical protein